MSHVFQALGLNDLISSRLLFVKGDLNGPYSCDDSHCRFVVGIIVLMIPSDITSKTALRL